jgi:hypothetical protein
LTLCSCYEALQAAGPIYLRRREIGWNNLAMTFEPPPRPRQMRADTLLSWPTPYVLKGLDDDSAWNLVETKPISRLVPDLLRVEVTVTFADGSARVFEPHNSVLEGPVTNRLAD